MKRFAVEWLWLIGCVVASSIITAVYLFVNPDPTSDTGQAAIILAVFATAGGITGYLVMGVIRLTVWAIMFRR